MGARVSAHMVGAGLADILAAAGDGADGDLLAGPVVAVLAAALVEGAGRLGRTTAWYYDTTGRRTRGRKV